MKFESKSQGAGQNLQRPVGNGRAGEQKGGFLPQSAHCRSAGLAPGYTIKGTLHLLLQPAPGAVGRDVELVEPARDQPTGIRRGLPVAAKS